MRIVGEIGVERRHQRISAEVTREDRIAVRVGACGAKRADGAASAADILHHDVLAEMPGENIGDNPPGDIGRPAGRERNDHGDRSCRIVLSQRTVECGCQENNGRRHPLSCHDRLLKTCRDIRRIFLFVVDVKFGPVPNPVTSDYSAATAKLAFSSSACSRACSAMAFSMLASLM